MILITNKNQIFKLLQEIDKPSMLRFDESYYNDINSIHCIIKFEKLSIYDLDQLMDINIDESLIKQSSRVLINITTNMNLRKIDFEAIAHIISTKTNTIEYHFNWEINFDFENDQFNLLLFFVEWLIEKSKYRMIRLFLMSCLY